MLILFGEIWIPGYPVWLDTGNGAIAKCSAKPVQTE
jgi:hypothetical protein